MADVGVIQAYKSCLSVQPSGRLPNSPMGLKGPSNAAEEAEFLVEEIKGQSFLYAGLFCRVYSVDTL